MQQTKANRSQPDLADSGNIKVLLIDANEEERHRWAARLLEYSPSYIVLETANALTGLKLYESEQVDCVVLDLELPDRSGLSLLLSLIPRGRYPEIAVVVLTDPGLEALFPLAIQGGAHSCLLKDRIAVNDLDLAIRKAVAAVGRKKTEQTD